MKIIGGQYRGRTLFAPKGHQVRPTTSRLRESLFDICGDIEGAVFLDLFAGGGAIGCEALSRGASHVTFVDNSRQSLAIVEKNVTLLGEKERSTLLCLDVFEALRKFVKKNEHFHLIFADPPYGKGYSDQVLAFIDAHSLLEKGGRLFLEDEKLHSGSPSTPLRHLTLISARVIGDAELREYQLRTRS